MDNQERQIVLQFYCGDKKIYWGNNVHLMDDDLLDQFLINFDPYLSSKNDKINLFNWFDDDTFLCEKEKNVYDYKLQSTVKIIYNATLTPEEASRIKDKLLEIYEETRIKFLSENKEVVKKQVLEHFNLTSLNLRGLRSTFLSKSDWTQVPDSPLDPEVKGMWTKYRQTLRDVTKDKNWSPRNILDVDFPIDPANYLLRYPDKEVEYLSTPDQFENHAAIEIKTRLAGFLEYLALPSAISSDHEPKIETYEILNEKMKKFMKKIDPEQEIDLDVKFKISHLGARSDMPFDLQSGMTKEAADVLMELADPDSYYMEKRLFSRGLGEKLPAFEENEPTQP